eukprot:s9610_g4.t1
MLALLERQMEQLYNARNPRPDGAGLGRLAGQDAGKGAGQHHATAVQWDSLHHVGSEDFLSTTGGMRYHLRCWRLQSAREHWGWTVQFSRTTTPMAPRFRLPSVVPLPAAGHAMMPLQTGGKRLSATLRDGVLLCAAFQSGNCATRGDSCADGRHRCAVLLQSGRICGGTHGAGECRVKRAIQAPESPPRTGTRAKAAPVVLRPKAKGKGQPEVKAMPKPKKMPRDAQLPPLKRMRLTPESRRRRRQGMKRQRWCLWSRTFPLLEGGLRSLRCHHRADLLRALRPRGRARCDWDDDRYQRHPGFLNDADFAYAFRSYEDAMAQAGTLVAEEWAVVRSSDTSGLYGAVASALDATEPAPRNPAPKRATTFMMRMASRGRAVRKPKVTAAEKPEARSEDQVEALTEALHCLESMKPRGNPACSTVTQGSSEGPRGGGSHGKRSVADLFGAPGPYGRSWSKPCCSLHCPARCRDVSPSAVYAVSGAEAAESDSAAYTPKSPGMITNASPTAQSWSPTLT